jgi:hypothetical protein
MKFCEKTVTGAKLAGPEMHRNSRRSEQRQRNCATSAGR